MNLTLRLIGSDFRHLRLFLSVWWGLVILQAVLIAFHPQLFSSGRPWLISPTFLAMLVAILKLCLLTVIVSQAVQKDSTVGSTAFWLSRPISRGRLLASKALFLVLAVVLPTLLVEVVSLRVCGVTQDDTLRSIPQMVFLQLLVTLVLMMLAALTPNLPRLILSGIIVVVGLPLLWFILLFLSALAMGAVTDPSVGVELVPPIPPPSFSSYFLGSLLVLLGTAGIVIGHQYLTRRTMLSGILLFSGVSLNFLTIGYWGSDWWIGASQLDKGILDPTQVTAQIEPKSLVFDLATSVNPLFDLTGEKKMLLRGNIALANVPPNIIALPARISAKLVLPSGESLAKHVSYSSYVFMAPDFIRRRRGLDREKASLIRPALGDVAFLDPERLRGQPPPELFAIREGLYERHRGVRLEYSAQVDYLVQRYEITTMRPEKGARFDRGSDHVEVLSVDPFYGGDLNIRLRETTHKLIVDSWKDMTYLLINPSRREAIFGSSGRVVGGYLSIPPMLSLVFPMLEVRWRILHVDRLSEGPPLHPAWIDGAELIRVETRDLGWFSKSIHLKGLVLEQIARSPPAPLQTGKDG